MNDSFQIEFNLLKTLFENSEHPKAKAVINEPTRKRTVEKSNGKKLFHFHTEHQGNTKKEIKKEQKNYKTVPKTEIPYRTQTEILSLLVRDLKKQRNG